MLKKNSDKTTNVRSLEGKWVSGVNRIPYEIASKIAAVVCLLQEQINKGNFQPLDISSTAYLCSLDMLIRPISEISQTHIKNGTRLQLVINGSSGAVMNNAKGMIAMEITTAEEGGSAIMYGTNVY